MCWDFTTEFTPYFKVISMLVGGDSEHLRRHLPRFSLVPGTESFCEVLYGPSCLRMFDRCRRLAK